MRFSDDYKCSDWRRTVSADGAKTHGSEFSSVHETVVVRICFVWLLSEHLLGVVVVSWGCVILNWHRHRFCSVPPWPRMIGRVVTFIKGLCKPDEYEPVAPNRCCVNGTRYALKLKICLVRLFPIELAMKRLLICSVYRSAPNHRMDYYIVFVCFCILYVTVMTHDSSRGGAAFSSMMVTSMYRPAITETSMYMCLW